MHVNLPSFTGKIAGTREKYKFSEIGVRTTNLQIFPWTLLTKKEMSKPTSEISRDPAAETLKKRVLVAEAYKQTNNVAQVARKYGVSKKYVRRWGKRDLAGEANMFQDAPRSGRPCKLTEEKQAAILACVDDKHNGIKCARHIRNHVQPGVSLTTVKRFLRREKCHYSGQVKVRRLTEEHRRKRYAFAKKFHDTSPFRSTGFSDSTFIKNGRPIKQWMREGAEMAVAYDRHPMKLHLYGMIGHGWRSPPYFATGTTKQKPYTEGKRGCTGQEYREQVLEKVFMPIIRERLMHNNGTWYFMQDGAKIHTAKLTKAKLEEFMGDHVMDWPPNSADLNPIEHVWNLIKEMLAGTNFRTVEEFKEAATKAWYAIDQRVINSLIDSVWRRCRKLVQAKGGYIRY